MHLLTTKHYNHRCRASTICLWANQVSITSLHLKKWLHNSSKEHSAGKRKQESSGNSVSWCDGRACPPLHRPQVWYWILKKDTPSLIDRNHTVKCSKQWLIESGERRPPHRRGIEPHIWKFSKITGINMTTCCGPLERAAV